MIDYIYDAMEKFFRRVAVFSPSRRRKKSVEENEVVYHGDRPPDRLTIGGVSCSVTTLFFANLKNSFFLWRIQK